MDAVASFLEEQTGSGPSRFLVTGASKRGWTTYLTAAVDERVAAIAPMVFDILNFAPQLELQRASFGGGYSEKLRAYGDRNLFALLESEEGAALREQVDPFAYRERLTLPKLILLGSNDPYWAVDAARLYFHELPGENRLFYAANAGHSLRGQILPTLLAFAHHTLQGQPLPELRWEQVGESLAVRWNAAATEALVWTAHSPTRDFREARWVSEPLHVEGGDRTATPLASPADAGFAARFVEVRFPGRFGSFGLTTEIFVTPASIKQGA
jgi:PhoPQ-activated pathogenicity-related protein